LGVFYEFCRMVRITIVTICFNNRAELLRTCESVDAQEQVPFEHLIIDGSSNSDIREWLTGAPQPPWRKWLCERDKGIADAFNKGIRLASGDVIQLLNSGDTLYDASVLRQVSEVFGKRPDAMWLHGKLNLFRAGVWFAAGKPFSRDKLYRGMHGVFHPTMFVRAQAYKKHGEYDIAIKYAMDYDYLCRLAEEPSVFLDYPVSTFDPTGISSVQYTASTREMLACYRKYFGKSLKQALWGWRLMCVHSVLQSKAGKLLYLLKVKAGLQKV
jgi:glycosyltransferase involved in cell wall biosynthesis